jgi:hypothetical protein
VPVPGRRTARDRVGTLPNFNENIEKGLTECPQARRDWVSLNRHMYTSDKRLRDFGGDPQNGSASLSSIMNAQVALPAGRAGPGRKSLRCART